MWSFHCHWQRRGDLPAATNCLQHNVGAEMRKHAVFQSPLPVDEAEGKPPEGVERNNSGDYNRS